MKDFLASYYIKKPNGWAPRLREQEVDPQKVYYSGSTLEPSLICSASINLKSPTFNFSSRGSGFHEEAEFHIRRAVEDLNYTVEEIPKEVKDYVEFVVDDVNLNADLIGIEVNLLGSYKSLDLKGTMDYLSYSKKNKELLILDLKAGAYPVEAKDNLQLIFYAYLASRTLLYNVTDSYNVKIMIYQNGEFKEDNFTKEAMQSLIESKLDQIEAVRNQGIKYNVGEHCKHCFKAANCESFLMHIKKLKDNYTKAHKAYSTHYEPSDASTRHYLYDLFKAARALKVFFPKVRQLVEKNMEENDPELTKYLEKKAVRSTKVWKDPKKLLAKFPELAEVKPLTPAKARARKLPVEGLTVKKESYFYVLNYDKEDEVLYD